MNRYSFNVLRHHHGDREYGPGEGEANKRELPVGDAVHLIRSGTLAPANKAAADAVADVLGPRKNWGIQPAATLPRLGDTGPADPDAMPADGGAAFAALRIEEGHAPTEEAKAVADAMTKDAGNAPENKADVAQPEAGASVAGSANSGPTTATAGASAPARAAPKRTVTSAAPRGKRR